MVRPLIACTWRYLTDLRRLLQIIGIKSCIGKITSHFRYKEENHKITFSHFFTSYFSRSVFQNKSIWGRDGQNWSYTKNYEAGPRGAGTGLCKQKAAKYQRGMAYGIREDKRGVAYRISEGCGLWNKREEGHHHTLKTLYNYLNLTMHSFFQNYWSEP